MDRLQNLGKDKISSLIWRFSLPAIAGMMINAGYSVIGAIFVGRGVGSMAISGIMVTFPIVILNIGFAMLSGLGAASLVSLKLGEGRKEEAENILGNALMLTFLSGILLTVFWLLFLNPVLKAFGARGESFVYAREYGMILAYGTILQLMAYSMNTLIRAEGNPVMALSTLAVGFLFYVILAPVLIFIFKLGMTGAGYAMILSQAVMAVWTFLYFYTKKSALHFHFKALILKKGLILKIMSIGISPFAMQLTGAVLLSLLNQLVGYYGGNLAIAAMGIAFTIYNFLSMPLVGLNQGLQPIIGFNSGAREFGRVKDAFFRAQGYAAVYCICCLFLILFFSRSIMSLYVKNDSALVDLGAHGMKIYLAAIPFFGFHMISVSYFMAAGKALMSLILSVLKQLVLFVPAIFILSAVWRLEGIWLTGPVTDVLAGLIAGIVVFREVRELGKRKLEIPA